MKYTIQRGDTLSGIAVKFKVDQATLARINGLDNPDRIYAGKEIEIPGATLFDRIKDLLTRKG